jgi:hemerythrin-like metal-binding protein
MNRADSQDLFKWSDDFALGNELIDSQHQRLFALLERLQQTLDSNTEKDAIIIATLEKLTDYTQQHFLEEERLMARINYPWFDQHKQQHDELIARVAALKEGFRSGKNPLSLELLVFLKDWLSNHILKEDTKIRDYIN